MGLFGRLRALFGGSAPVPDLGMPPPADPLEVTGVVAETGAMAFQRDGKRYDFSVLLVAWRQDRGPAQSRLLRIERTIKGRDEAERWKAMFPARGTVRMRIEAPPRDRAGILVADLAEWLSGSHDSELERLAHASLNPEPYEHPVLGTIKPDPDFSSVFTCLGDWLGAEVEFVFNVRRGERPDALVPVLDLVLADPAGWQARARQKIAEDLFATWQADWNKTGEVLDVTAWLDRMKLLSISVSDDEGIEFDFDDNGLFGDQGVFVSGTREGFDLAELVA